MENSKEVVLAILGASVALAGLLLVVSGYVFSQVNAFPSGTDNKILDSYRLAGKLGLIPFIIALCDAAIGLWWLLVPSSCAFSTVVGGFFLLLFLTALYGAVLILRYL
jgi:hypothetical protein